MRCHSTICRLGAGVRQFVMRRMVFGTALLLGGCVQHNFVPGLGMSSTNLEPDSAICRLVARGEKSDFSFQASGSPKFTAAATGAAIIGYTISSAIEQNANFNDCMVARGWLVADASQPVGVTPSAIEAAPEQPAAVTNLVALSELPPLANSRRQFLVRAADVPFAIADFRPPHGVIILEVGIGGAASSAGLKERDVILGFNGSPIANVDDLRRVLASVGSHSTVIANIRRNSESRRVTIHF
jgi:membrane-associated protease RseP (regulator of RpoE activity)